jgi:hypothetical protein
MMVPFDMDTCWRYFTRLIDIIGLKFHSMIKKTKDYEDHPFDSRIRWKMLKFQWYIIVVKFVLYLQGPKNQIR